MSDQVDHRKVLYSPQNILAPIPMKLGRYSRFDQISYKPELPHDQLLPKPLIKELIIHSFPCKPQIWLKYKA